MFMYLYTHHELFDDFLLNTPEYSAVAKNASLRIPDLNSGSSNY